MTDPKKLRLLHYSGTVQCIVLLDIGFTLISIIYPPTGAALIFIAPLALCGFVGARRYNIPLLTVVIGIGVLWNF